MPITSKEDSHTPPDFVLLGIVEQMINTYNLSEREKMTYRQLLEKVDNQQDLENLFNLIAPNKLIMGIEAIPLDVKQQAEALRNKMIIEDFKERHDNTKRTA